ncbi:MAG: hypothetical protein R3291_04745, partial [Thermoplasmata archaeon]|nr:hypothetical protein [Thermoplasmata archaeon]
PTTPPSGTSRSKIDPPFREFEVTLNVLRLPPKAATHTAASQPPGLSLPPLRRAMDQADREHERVLAEVREPFCYGVASPTVLPITRPVADRLQASLNLSEEAVGILGPATIHRGEAAYSVWVRLQLCG